MSLAMHCNLRPPDVAPIVLGFNYEAHIMPTDLTFQQPGYRTMEQSQPWCR